MIAKLGAKGHTYNPSYSGGGDQESHGSMSIISAMCEALGR
jgi:hypothetical protein